MAEVELKDIKSVVSRLDTSTELSVEQCCEASGVTLQKIYATLNDLFDARIYAKDRYGETTELGPDNRVRLAAVSLALELRKHIKNKDGAGSANQLNIIIKSRGKVEEGKATIEDAIVTETSNG